MTQKIKNALISVSDKSDLQKILPTLESKLNNEREMILQEIKQEKEKETEEEETNEG